jgi:hypothetical protein
MRGVGVRWFMMMVCDDCRLVYGDFVGWLCMVMIMSGLERGDNVWWSRIVKVVGCLRQTRLLHTKETNQTMSNRMVGVSGEIRTMNTIQNLPRYDLI